MRYTFLYHKPLDKYTTIFKDIIMQTLHKGLLVALEGIDGSGKSTLASNLTQALEQNNMPVFLTKEPGGSLLGKQLRDILQKQVIPLDPQAELLLFAADRAQHFAEIIIPYLNQNKVIISDRMADSSLVYQGYGRGLSLEFIHMVNTWAMRHICPHITLYIKVDAQTAHHRLRQRNNGLSAFEQDRTLLAEKLIQGFDELYKNRNDVIVIDGIKSPEEITNQALHVINAWINKETPA